MANVIRATTSVRIGNAISAASVSGLSVVEAIDRIEQLNTQLAKFWSKSDGWAPAHVAGLLGKSRLDWQVSLSRTLRFWIKDSELSEGELILAWANLGSLFEGSVKLLLSVYFDTFETDLENLKKANAFNHKQGVAHSPDGLTLEPLRKYCAAKKIFEPKHLSLMETVQLRRNAIHAFKDRPIGNTAEVKDAILGYLELLREIVRRLPYPDDMYVPHE